jgi:ribosomal protein S3AE
MTKTTGSGEMPLPRRYIKQILRVYDRGGRKAASRMGQRAVARGLVRSLLGRRRTS